MSISFHTRAAMPATDNLNNSLLIKNLAKKLANYFAPYFKQAKNIEQPLKNIKENPAQKIIKPLPQIRVGKPINRPVVIQQLQPAKQPAQINTPFKPAVNHPLQQAVKAKEPVEAPIQKPADLPLPPEFRFAKEQGHTVLYKNGQPHTGLAPSKNNQGIVFYKNGQARYPLAPSYNDLIVKQGSSGDCYLLAALLGLFSNPNTSAAINKMCRISSKGELVISFQPNLAKAPSHIRQQFENFLNDKHALNDLKNKGYDLQFAQQNNTLTVRITEKKLLAMINQQVGRAYNHTGAQTNSLFIMAMEHLFGNFIMLMQGHVKETQNQSLAIHFNRHVNVDLYQFFGYLMQYKVGQAAENKPARLRITPSSLDSLLKHCAYFDEQKVGTAHQNNKGFVVVSYQYGQAHHGQVHSRHALALRKVLRNQNNQIYALELVNPWGKIDTLKIKDAIQKDVAFMYYVPENTKVA